MRLAGGRSKRAGFIRIPTARSLAALLTTMLLVGSCSGAGDQASTESPSAGRADPGESGDEAIPDAAGLSTLLRRLDLIWTDDVSYTFTTRTQGNAVATVRARGTFRGGRIQQMSRWRLEGDNGVARWRFAFNSTTNSLVGAGLKESAGFRPVYSGDSATIEAVYGPGVGGLPFWTNRISDSADRITELDLDVDGSGDKVSFRLPSRVWMLPEDPLPPEVAGTTDYELTFEGQKLVRIEALRDDSAIDVRIRYGPYRRITLPAVSYRGP